MTEAELADLVERRATEKAQALHQEQKRVELEAVKAELAVPEEQPVSETSAVNLHAMLEEAREQAERDRIGRELRPRDEPT